MQIINYFISENYIKDWTLEDAYREILQNFIDYGDYNIDINAKETSDFISIGNTFNPNSTDLLIIGESNKENNKIGKYGEGLKMAALVLLRNGYSLAIYTNTFSAKFVIIDNPTTTIRTLGVELSNPYDGKQVNSFDLRFSAPRNSFQAYTETLIKPEDLLHTREGHGSIVNREKGNLYVGGLFVCKLAKLNYAYNLLPKNIELDRDRKVPRDFQVKWDISKIQETYEEFDRVGKSEDVTYSTIPDSYIPNYIPKISNGKVTFVTKVKNENGNDEEVEVSDRYKQQLMSESFFRKMVIKLTGFITNSLGITEAAINFRTKYCHSDQAKREFNQLLARLGVNLIKD